MGRKRREIPDSVIELGGRIEQWRQERVAGTPMPATLWEAATLEAVQHGAFLVSRGARISYPKLRRLAKKQMPEGEELRQDFAELSAKDASLLFSPATAQEAVLEFSRPDGASLKLHMGAHLDLDVSALLRAFWRGE